MKKNTVNDRKELNLLNILTLTWGVVGFVVLMLIIGFTELDPVITAACVTIGYVVAVEVSVLLYRFYKNRTDGVQRPDVLLGQLMVDVVLKMHMPVIICDMNGKLIWYNSIFSSLAANGGNIHGKNAEEVCGISSESLRSGVAAQNITLGDRDFSTSVYNLNTGDKSYRLVVFNDRTEANNLLTMMNDEDTVVVYAMIDNIDELSQYVQEKYRSASAEISEILGKWVAENGGMIKEYERDKFILFMSHKSLSSVIEKRFSIIDEIHGVRVGDGSIPITVSMGVSGIKGPLSEKERAAQAALDLALQRGGDQVVVKREDSTDFYGGRTRTVQKKAKVRARVTASQLIAKITVSDRVMIMGHKYADFDCIGSCVGLSRLADFCGVPSTIVADPEDENVKICLAKLGNLPQYSGRFVDKKTALDMMSTGTMLIIADVNNFDHIESPRLAENATSVAIIDHHRKTAEFERDPEIAYIEPSASSCCELVSEILEQAVPAGTLVKEEADLMLAGMLLDTKQFTRNTGTRTFSAAQYLRGEGAVPSDAQELFKTGLDDFLREAKFENDIVIYRGNIAIARSEGDGVPQDRIAAAKAADKLLGISGIMASFALVKIGNTVHISARSTGKINVQLILESLSGGGHFDVAGAQIADRTVYEALTMLKDAIDRYLDA